MLKVLAGLLLDILLKVGCFLFLSGTVYLLNLMKDKNYWLTTMLFLISFIIMLEVHTKLINIINKKFGDSK